MQVKSVYKITAILTAAIFLFTEVLPIGKSYAAYSSPVSNQSSDTQTRGGSLRANESSAYQPSSASAKVQGVVLPSGLGHIQDKFEGSSDKLVITIQDAHAIPEAQHSIRKIIEELSARYGIQTVALEGVEGPLDLTLFRAVPDKEALEKTFTGYLDTGELSGAVAAGVLNKSELHLSGIESWPLYEDGVTEFLKALRSKPELTRELASLRAELDHLKKQYYSREAQGLTRQLKDAALNPDKMIEILDGLSKIVRPGEETYPNLAAVLHLSENDHSANAEVFDREINSLAEQIKKHIDDDTVLRSFNAKVQGWQTGQTGRAEFADYLLQVAPEDSLTAPLAALVESHRRLKGLQGNVFYTEFSAYSKELKTKILKTREERILDNLESRIDLLDKLAELKLTIGEWKNLKESIDHSPQFTEKAEGGRLKAEGATSDRQLSTLQNRLEAFISSLPSRHPHFICFYETAEKRDAVFVEKIKAMLGTQTGDQRSETIEKSEVGSGTLDRFEQDLSDSRSITRYPTPVTRHPASALIVVAGGFHTEGLKEAFRNDNISYVTIAPQMTRVPEDTKYLDYMQGRVSWKDYFRVKNGRIDLYDAFARAVVDRLLQEDREPVIGDRKEVSVEQSSIHESRFPLKLWRDQLIRTMAGRGQAGDSAKHTHFLDRAASKFMDAGRAKALKAEWTAKLEKFILGLQSLEKQGQLNESGMMNLLQQKTTIAYTAVPFSSVPAKLLEIAEEGIGREGTPIEPVKAAGVVNVVAEAEKSRTNSRHEMRTVTVEGPDGPVAIEMPDEAAEQIGVWQTSEPDEAILAAIRGKIARSPVIDMEVLREDDRRWLMWGIDHVFDPAIPLEAEERKDLAALLIQTVDDVYPAADSETPEAAVPASLRVEQPSLELWWYLWVNLVAAYARVQRRQDDLAQRHQEFIRDLCQIAALRYAFAQSVAGSEADLAHQIRERLQGLARSQAQFRSAIAEILGFWEQWISHADQSHDTLRQKYHRVSQMEADSLAADSGFRLGEHGIRWLSSFIFGLIPKNEIRSSLWTHPVTALAAQLSQDDDTTVFLNTFNLTIPSLTVTMDIRLAGRQMPSDWQYQLDWLGAMAEAGFTDAAITTALVYAAPLLAMFGSGSSRQGGLPVLLNRLQSFLDDSQPLSDDSLLSALGLSTAKRKTPALQAALTFWKQLHTLSSDKNHPLRIRLFSIQDLRNEDPSETAAVESLRQWLKSTASRKRLVMGYAADLQWGLTDGDLLGPYSAPGIARVIQVVTDGVPPNNFRIPRVLSFSVYGLLEISQNKLQLRWGESESIAVPKEAVEYVSKVPSDIDVVTHMGIELAQKAWEPFYRHYRAFVVTNAVPPALPKRKVRRKKRRSEMREGNRREMRDVKIEMPGKPVVIQMSDQAAERIAAWDSAGSDAQAIDAIKRRLSQSGTRKEQEFLHGDDTQWLFWGIDHAFDPYVNQLTEAEHKALAGLLIRTVEALYPVSMPAVSAAEQEGEGFEENERYTRENFDLWWYLLVRLMAASVRFRRLNPTLQIVMGDRQRLIHDLCQIAISQLSSTRTNRPMGHDIANSMAIRLDLLTEIYPVLVNNEVLRLLLAWKSQIEEQPDTPATVRKKQPMPDYLQMLRQTVASAARKAGLEFDYQPPVLGSSYPGTRIVMRDKNGDPLAPSGFRIRKTPSAETGSFTAPVSGEVPAITGYVVLAILKMEDHEPYLVVYPEVDFSRFDSDRLIPIYFIGENKLKAGLYRPWPKDQFPFEAIQANPPKTLGDKPLVDLTFDAHDRMVAIYPDEMVAEIPAASAANHILYGQDSPTGILLSLSEAKRMKTEALERWNRWLETEDVVADEDAATEDPLPYWNIPAPPRIQVKVSGGPSMLNVEIPGALPIHAFNLRELYDGLNGLTDFQVNGLEYDEDEITAVDLYSKGFLTFDMQTPLTDIEDALRASLFRTRGEMRGDGERPEPSSVPREQERGEMRLSDRREDSTSVPRKPERGEMRGDGERPEPSSVPREQERNEMRNFLFAAFCGLGEAFADLLKDTLGGLRGLRRSRARDAVQARRLIRDFLKTHRSGEGPVLQRIESLKTSDLAGTVSGEVGQQLRLLFDRLSEDGTYNATLYSSIEKLLVLLSYIPVLNDQAAKTVMKILFCELAGPSWFASLVIENIGPANVGFVDEILPRLRSERMSTAVHALQSIAAVSSNGAEQVLTGLMREEDFLESLSPAARDLLIQLVFEPLMIKTPHLMTPQVIERLRRLNEQQPISSFRYFNAYADIFAGQAVSQKDFPLREQYKKYWSGEGRKLLIIDEHACGRGDVIIRSVIMRALKAANPKLEIHLYTKYPNHFDPGMVKAHPLEDLEQSGPSGSPYDVLIHFYRNGHGFQPRGWMKEKSLVITQNLYGADHVGQSYLDFEMREWEGGIVRTTDHVSIRKESNAYAQKYRLALTLGARPFPVGDEKFPVLLKLSSAEAVQYWEQMIVPQIPEGGTVEVINGPGYGRQTKGFGANARGMGIFRKKLKGRLADPKKLLLLLSNAKPWGSPEHLAKLIEPFTDEDKSRIVIVEPASEQIPALYDYLCKKAHESGGTVSTTEGGLVHMLSESDVPFVFLMPENHAITGQLVRWPPLRQPHRIEWPWEFPRGGTGTTKEAELEPSPAFRRELRAPKQLPIRDYIAEMLPFFEGHVLREPEEKSSYELKPFELPLKRKGINRKAAERIANTLAIWRNMAWPHDDVLDDHLVFHPIVTSDDDALLTSFEKFTTVVGMDISLGEAAEETEDFTSQLLNPRQRVRQTSGRPRNRHRAHRVEATLFHAGESDFLSQMMQISFRRKIIFFPNRFLEIAPEELVMELLQIGQTLIEAYDGAHHYYRTQGKLQGVDSPGFAEIQRDISKRLSQITRWDPGLWRDWIKVRQYNEKTQFSHRKTRATLKLLEQPAESVRQGVEKVLIQARSVIPSRDAVLEGLEKLFPAQPGDYSGAEDRAWKILQAHIGTFRKLAWFYDYRAQALRYQKVLKKKTARWYEKESGNSEREAEKHRNKVPKVLEMMQQIDAGGIKPLTAEEMLLYDYGRQGKVRELMRTFRELMSAAYVPEEGGARASQLMVHQLALPAWLKSAIPDLLYKLSFHYRKDTGPRYDYTTRIGNFSIAWYGWFLTVLNGCRTAVMTVLIWLDKRVPQEVFRYVKWPWVGWLVQFKRVPGRLFDRARKVLKNAYEEVQKEENIENKFNVDLRALPANPDEPIQDIHLRGISHSFPDTPGGRILSKPYLIFIKRTNDVLSFVWKAMRIDEHTIAVRIEGAIYHGDQRDSEAIGHLDMFLQKVPQAQETDETWKAEIAFTHSHSAFVIKREILRDDKYPRMAKAFLQLALRLAASSGVSRLDLYLTGGDEDDLRLTLTTEGQKKNVSRRPEPYRNMLHYVFGRSRVRLSQNIKAREYLRQHPADFLAPPAARNEIRNTGMRPDLLKGIDLRARGEMRSQSGSDSSEQPYDFRGGLARSNDPKTIFLLNTDRYIGNESDDVHRYREEILAGTAGIDLEGWLKLDSFESRLRFLANENTGSLEDVIQKIAGDKELFRKASVIASIHFYDNYGWQEVIFSESSIRLGKDFAERMVRPLRTPVGKESALRVLAEMDGTFQANRQIPRMIFENAADGLKLLLAEEILKAPNEAEGPISSLFSYRDAGDLFYSYLGIAVRSQAMTSPVLNRSAIVSTGKEMSSLQIELAYCAARSVLPVPGPQGSEQGLWLPFDAARLRQFIDERSWLKGLAALQSELGNLDSPRFSDLQGSDLVDKLLRLIYKHRVVMQLVNPSKRSLTDADFTAIASNFSESAVRSTAPNDKIKRLIRQYIENQSGHAAETAPPPRQSLLYEGSANPTASDFILENVVLYVMDPDGMQRVDPEMYELMEILIGRPPSREAVRARQSTEREDTGTLMPEFLGRGDAANALNSPLLEKADVSAEARNDLADAIGQVLEARMPQSRNAIIRQYVAMIEAVEGDLRDPQIRFRGFDELRWADSYAIGQIYPEQNLIEIGNGIFDPLCRDIGVQILFRTVLEYHLAREVRAGRLSEADADRLRIYLPRWLFQDQKNDPLFWAAHESFVRLGKDRYLQSAMERFDDFERDRPFHKTRDLFDSWMDYDSRGERHPVLDQAGFLAQKVYEREWYNPRVMSEDTDEKLREMCGLTNMLLFYPLLAFAAYRRDFFHVITGFAAIEESSYKQLIEKTMREVTADSGSTKLFPGIFPRMGRHSTDEDGTVPFMTYIGQMLEAEFRMRGVTTNPEIVESNAHVLTARHYIDPHGIMSSGGVFNFTAAGYLLFSHPEAYSPEMLARERTKLADRLKRGLLIPGGWFSRNAVKYFSGDLRVPGLGPLSVAQIQDILRSGAGLSFEYSVAEDGPSAGPALMTLHTMGIPSVREDAGSVHVVERSQTQQTHLKGDTADAGESNRDIVMAWLGGAPIAGLRSPTRFGGTDITLWANDLRANRCEHNLWRRVFGVLGGQVLAEKWSKDPEMIALWPFLFQLRQNLTPKISGKTSNDFAPDGADIKKWVEDLMTLESVSNLSLLEYLYQKYGHDAALTHALSVGDHFDRSLMWWYVQSAHPRGIYALLADRLDAADTTGRLSEESQRLLLDGLATLFFVNDLAGLNWIGNKMMLKDIRTYLLLSPEGIRVPDLDGLKQFLRRDLVQDVANLPEQFSQWKEQIEQSRQSEMLELKAAVEKTNAGETDQSFSPLVFGPAHLPDIRPDGPTAAVRLRGGISGPQGVFFDTESIEAKNMLQEVAARGKAGHREYEAVWQGTYLEGLAIPGVPLRLVLEGDFDGHVLEVVADAKHMVVRDTASGPDGEVLADVPLHQLKTNILPKEEVEGRRWRLTPDLSRVTVTDLSEVHKVPRLTENGFYKISLRGSDLLLCRLKNGLLAAGMPALPDGTQTVVVHKSGDHIRVYSEDGQHELGRAVYSEAAQAFTKQAGDESFVVHERPKVPIGRYKPGAVTAAKFIPHSSDEYGRMVTLAHALAPLLQQGKRDRTVAIGGTRQHLALVELRNEREFVLDPYYLEHPEKARAAVETLLQDDPVFKIQHAVRELQQLEQAGREFDVDLDHFYFESVRYDDSWDESGRTRYETADETLRQTRGRVFRLQNLVYAFEAGGIKAPEVLQKLRDQARKLVKLVEADDLEKGSKPLYLRFYPWHSGLQNWSAQDPIKSASEVPDGTPGAGIISLRLLSYDQTRDTYVIGHNASANTQLYFFVRSFKSGQETIKIYDLSDGYVVLHSQDDERRYAAALQGAILEIKTQIHARYFAQTEKSEAEPDAIDRQMDAVLDSFFEGIAAKRYSLEQQSLIAANLKYLHQRLDFKDYSPAINLSVLKMILAFVGRNGSGALERSAAMTSETGAEALSNLAFALYEQLAEHPEIGLDPDQMGNTFFEQQLTRFTDDVLVPSVQMPASSWNWRGAVAVQISSDELMDPAYPAVLFSYLAGFQHSLLAVLGDKPEEVIEERESSLSDERPSYQWRTAALAARARNVSEASGGPLSVTPAEAYFVQLILDARRAAEEARVLAGQQLQEITSSTRADYSVTIQDLGGPVILEVCGLRILFDPGLERGLSQETYRTIDRPVDLVVISHAHEDHYGSMDILDRHLRALNQRFGRSPDVPYLMTRGTRTWLKHAVKSGDPRYQTFQEILSKRTVEVHYGKPLQFSEDVVLDFGNPGHIAGAVYVKVLTSKGNFLWPGDFTFHRMGKNAGFNTEIKEPIQVAFVDASLAFMDAKKQSPAKGKPQPQVNGEQAKRRDQATVRMIYDALRANSHANVLILAPAGVPYHLYQLLVENQNLLREHVTVFAAGNAALEIMMQAYLNDGVKNEQQMPMFHAIGRQMAENASMEDILAMEVEKRGARGVFLLQAKSGRTGEDLVAKFARYFARGSNNLLIASHGTPEFYLQKLFDNNPQYSFDTRTHKFRRRVTSSTPEERGAESVVDLAAFYPLQIYSHPFRHEIVDYLTQTLRPWYAIAMWGNLRVRAQWKKDMEIAREQLLDADELHHPMHIVHNFQSQTSSTFAPFGVQRGGKEYLVRDAWNQHQEWFRQYRDENVLRPFESDFPAWQPPPSSRYEVRRRSEPPVTDGVRAELRPEDIVIFIVQNRLLTFAAGGAAGGLAGVAYILIRKYFFPKRIPEEMTDRPSGPSAGSEVEPFAAIPGWQATRMRRDALHNPDLIAGLIRPMILQEDINVQIPRARLREIQDKAKAYGIDAAKALYLARWFSERPDGPRMKAAPWMVNFYQWMTVAAERLQGRAPSTFDVDRWMPQFIDRILNASQDEWITPRDICYQLIDAEWPKWRSLGRREDWKQLYAEHLAAAWPHISEQLDQFIEFFKLLRATRGLRQASAGRRSSMYTSLMQRARQILPEPLAQAVNDVLRVEQEKAAPKRADMRLVAAVVRNGGIQRQDVRAVLAEGDRAAGIGQRLRAALRAGWRELLGQQAFADMAGDGGDPDGGYVKVEQATRAAGMDPQDRAQAERFQLAVDREFDAELETLGNKIRSGEIQRMAPVIFYQPGMEGRLSRFVRAVYDAFGERGDVTGENFRLFLISEDRYREPFMKFSSELKKISAGEAVSAEILGRYESDRKRLARQLGLKIFKPFDGYYSLFFAPQDFRALLEVYSKRVIQSEDGQNEMASVLIPGIAGYCAVTADTELEDATLRQQLPDDLGPAVAYGQNGTLMILVTKLAEQFARAARQFAASA